MASSDIPLVPYCAIHSSAYAVQANKSIHQFRILRNTICTYIHIFSYTYTKDPYNTHIYAHCQLYTHEGVCTICTYMHIVSYTCTKWSVQYAHNISTLSVIHARRGPYNIHIHAPPSLQTLLIMISVFVSLCNCNKQA